MSALLYGQYNTQLRFFQLLQITLYQSEQIIKLHMIL